MFERFFRIDDRDSDGCGLGLATVREYARQSGASLSLETPAGGVGLAARVALPHAVAGPDAATSTHAAAGPDAASSTHPAAAQTQRPQPASGLPGVTK